MMSLATSQKPCPNPLPRPWPFPDQPARGAGRNSLGQILRVILLAALTALGIGLALSPRAGHAAPGVAEADRGRA